MNTLKPLIILTGKTASGKDAVMAGLLSCFPNFKRVVTTTSRNPRPGEQNGIDYFFISREQFKQKINESRFIEYVKYGGNLYGTEKNQILDNLDSGLIWRIDPSRAGQIKEMIRDSFESNKAEEILKRVVVIYLTTDNTVILDRLKKRNMDQEEIDKRLQEDQKFWETYQTSYDFVVENVPGQLDQTVDKIRQIIENRFS